MRKLYKHPLAARCAWAICSLALIWGPLTVLAQSEPDAESPDATPQPSGTALNANRPEFGGVITNQTLTSLGHFFHSKFSEEWTKQPDYDNYSLLVKERPSPRSGTEMQVLFGEIVVFRGLMPRNYVQVIGMAEAAAAQSHKNVVEIGIQTLLFNDPDMANSGF